MCLTATEDGPLTLCDVEGYFDSLRLGRLYFPNGDNITTEGEPTKLFISLEELYSIIVRWSIRGRNLSAESIIAVIAFGSAVEYPGFRLVKRKRFFGFLSRTEIVNIQPKDTDFLVITKSDVLPVDDMTVDTRYARDYYGDLYLISGGMHVVHRTDQQVIKGAHNNDTVSQSALRSGVVVFTNGEHEDLFRKANIFCENPRMITWCARPNKSLQGKII